MKTFSDAQFGFKSAVRRVVKSVGGLSAAADVVRVDAPRLSRYGNLDALEFAPVDVCFVLDASAVAAGGDPEILQAYAAELGFDLVPKKAALVSDDLNHATGRLAKETGEMVYAASVAGPNPPPAVARRLHDEACDVIEAAGSVLKIVRPAMGGK